MLTKKTSTREIQRAAAGNSYTCFHAPRYATVIELVRPFVRGASTRILDIGRSDLTSLLHENLNVPVDTLGFDAEGPTATGFHYQFDLNQSQSADRWRRNLPRYDVVVMAEVIEHLYTAPSLVLAFLKTLLQPSGVLIIQTPNALSLTRRIKPLLGIHPYEKIREDNTNPGHFREYTGPELRTYAEKCGYDVVHLGYYNYFDLRFSDHTGAKTPRWVEALKYRSFALLPGRLKPGMTLILRPTAEAL